MPQALPNLYAKPADLYDYLGTEGVQLRLDDHSLASGQTIQVTQNALQNDTTLFITALEIPILTGTLLEFDGGGTPQVVEVQTTAVARTGDTSLTVAPLPYALNALSEAFDSGVNLATGMRLLKACQYGTSQVGLYCQSKYDDSQLANAWSPNRWATYLAAKWLCSRRGNAVPGSVLSDAEEAIEEMKQVRCGMLAIEGIPTRTAGWPFISNVTVNIGYTTTKARIEQPLSELTPTQYPQYVDWNSILWIEY